MTLESEINQLKVAIEEVKDSSSSDLSSWLTANRDHLLLMAAELLLIVLILSCFFSSNSSTSSQRRSSSVGISPAELQLLNAQTGANVKVSGAVGRFIIYTLILLIFSFFSTQKSLHLRSKSLSDLQAAADNQQQPPPPSDRSRAEEETIVVQESSSIEGTEESKTRKDSVCKSVDNSPNCDTSNSCTEVDSSSSSSSSNKENMNCASPATPLANGGSSFSNNSFFVGNGILRPSTAMNHNKGILNESGNNIGRR